MRRIIRAQTIKLIIIGVWYGLVCYRYFTDKSSIKNFTNHFIEQALRISNQVRWSFSEHEKYSRCSITSL